MEKMIATCGLTCTDCEAYKATKDGDDAALEALAKTWSEQFGATLTAEDCACNGCHAATGPWMSHCAECEIRACGTEHGVDNCAECSSYVCDKLSQFFEFAADAKTTLDGLRANT